VNRTAAPIYSVEISEDEKLQAQETRNAFESLSEHLDESFDKLKIVRELLEQFKDPSHFAHMRDLFIRYKQAVINEFNEFLDSLTNSLTKMNKTLSDSEMQNITDTIVAEADELRDGVEELAEHLDEPDSPDFLKNFKETYDRLDQRRNSLHEIITDHLFEHIDYDILGRIKLGSNKIKLSKRGS
jgi:uncharacterized phage infection (PIP) family protein YhgE